MSGFSSVGRACDCRSLAVVITRSVVRIRQPGTKYIIIYLIIYLINVGGLNPKACENSEPNILLSI